MRQQILLLLGLILIGALGLAAGIEASKGNWAYHSLSSNPELTTDEPVLVLTTTTPAKSPSF